MHKQSIQPIDSAHYTYWQALYMAFYSRALYMDVAKRWRGFAWRYVFIVVTCITLPFSAQLTQAAYQQIATQYLEPISELPPLWFSHGELLFTQPMPYLIRNKQQEVIAIIDTTGTIDTHNALNYPHLVWLFNQHAVHYRIQTPVTSPQQPLDKTWLSETLTADFSGFFDLHTWLQSKGIERMAHGITWFTYPLTVLFFSIQALICLWVLASVGRLFAHIVIKQPITYRVSFRLMAVSATVPLVLGSLLFLIGYDQFGYAWYLLFLILIVYYFSAVIRFGRSNRTMVI